MGRKIKLTPELIKIAEETATTHWRDEPVWQRMGISNQTFYTYKARGERESDRLNKLRETEPDTIHEPDPNEAIFLDFLDALNRARAKLLAGIETATIGNALKNGNLGLRLLERFVPDEYGAPTRVELTGRDGGPIDVAGQELAKQMAEEVERLAREARGD